jgi:signal transduction histidine kinase
VPLEVRDLEAAFRALWDRLEEMVTREREFAANASHELRMPLTRIRLNAERALADAGPQGRAALETQAQEVDRLTRLVDSLLVLARDTSSGIPGAETVNLADVCRRAAARALPDSRSAECRFPDEALVRGDEALIEIAVANLVDNARKFAASEEPVRAVLADGHGSFVLEVTTPGARIADADRDRLFDRFHRGPKSGSLTDGHGLGLALARHVARLHGGDLRCVSTEAEDARFALELPSWTEAPSSGA